MSQPVIAADSQVTLHFTLQLQDGQVIDTTRNRPEPVTFTIGDGNLLPGFERKLLGLRPGDSAEFDVLPEEAFGQPNPANLQRFDRKQFEGTELAEGLVISFADAQQSELPGVVARFDDSEVVVDFNHPLAGRTIVFSVEILGVEAGQGATS
jgi:FKBP-type peptidyl-prolyl cis-trans isomerase SlpA